ncbi:hypothetical protein QNZ67_002610 [Vibrio parahaemolyticus]|nr:hypothetical protein [Vibrio parahaemolyticus]
MNTKNNTVSVSTNTEINKSFGSGFMFSSLVNDFILTSKHTICSNYSNCTNKVCSNCQTSFEKESISINSVKLSIESIYQSKNSDVALIKCSNFTNQNEATIYHSSNEIEEYITWKGNTNDRLILDAPIDINDNAQHFNISNNINAHENAKNDEVTGFSGSPIFAKVDGKFYLNGIVTDSVGISDIKAEKLSIALIEELENYANQTLFYTRSEKDIIDKVMESNSNNHLSPSVVINALEHLIIRSQDMAKEDPEYRDMLEELQDFLKARPGRNIIGLENKLLEGEREDLIEDAQYLESKFARKVARGQLSDKEEIVYFHCLSKINSFFNSYIKPKIKANESNENVDSSIQDKIINPIYEEVIVVHTMSTEMIRGMLYYLTGKCHLRWKK